MNWIHRGVLRKILNIITYRVTLGPRLAKCGEMQPKLDLILVDNGTRVIKIEKEFGIE
jgi:hypothetical protein